MIEKDIICFIDDDDLTYYDVMQDMAQRRLQIAIEIALLAPAIVFIIYWLL